MFTKTKLALFLGIINYCFATDDLNNINEEEKHKPITFNVINKGFNPLDTRSLQSKGYENLRIRLITSTSEGSWGKYSKQYFNFSRYVPLVNEDSVTGYFFRNDSYYEQLPEFKNYRTINEFENSEDFKNYETHKKSLAEFTRLKKGYEIFMQINAAAKEKLEETRKSIKETEDKINEFEHSEAFKEYQILHNNIYQKDKEYFHKYRESKKMPDDIEDFQKKHAPSKLEGDKIALIFTADSIKDSSRYLIEEMEITCTKEKPWSYFKNISIELNKIELSSNLSNFGIDCKIYGTPYNSNEKIKILYLEKLTIKKKNEYILKTIRTDYGIK